MQKLIKVLFLLVSAISFNSYTMEVKEPSKEKSVSKLYKFFKMEKFNDLDPEIKNLIIQQFGGQWWCNVTNFKHLGSGSIIGPEGLRTSVAFSPEGDKILTGLAGALESTPIKLWDIDGNCLATFGEFSQVFSVAFDPRGDKVLTGGHKVKFWDLNANPIKTFQPDGTVSIIAFNPEGDKILTGPRGFFELTDNSAKLWDLNGNCIATFNHNDCVNSAVFSPKGDKVLSSSDDKTAKIWDIDGNCLVTFQHENGVLSAAFSPKGDKVLTGSLDHTTKLWDLNGNCLATLTHRNWVELVAFNPAGDNILTLIAGYKSLVKLWDLNGNCLATLHHNDRVNSVVFSPKGDKLLIGLADGTAKLWVLHNPTLEQLLLRKLIHLYLQSEKPVQEIQSPEMLFRAIVCKFNAQDVALDIQELINVWNLIPEKVRNSFWKSIQKTISKFGKNSSN